MTELEQQFWTHFDDRASSWRDGCPDTDALAKMSAEERARVEAVLLDRLSQRPLTCPEGALPQPPPGGRGGPCTRKWR